MKKTMNYNQEAITELFSDVKTAFQYCDGININLVLSKNNMWFIEAANIDNTIVTSLSVMPEKLTADYPRESADFIQTFYEYCIREVLPQN